MPSSVVPLLTLLAACGGAPRPAAAPPPAPARPPEAPAPAAPPPRDPGAVEVAPAETPRLAADDATLAEATKRAAAAAGEARLGLTLDRPLYRPGERIWARVWALGAGDLGARSREDVVVRLLDPRGTEVARGRWQNGGAGASADLVIPAGASGGLWTLRATVGRREISRPLVVATFEEPRIRKELELLRDAYVPGDRVTAALTVSRAGGGPLADHPVQVLVQVAGEPLPPIAARTDTRGEALLDFALPEHVSAPDAVVTVVVEDEGWSEAVSRPIPVVLDALRVEAFPEGGTFVAGLPARLYLRVRDAAGQPADAAGVIEDHRGREVARFETLHDGLARAAFTPAAGTHYRARIGDREPFPLLAPTADGCVLRTWDDPDGRLAELRAGVWCATPRTVVVSGHLRGHAYVPAAVEAGPDAPAVVHLRTERPEDGLLQGVATVTVSDAALEPIAERLVYRNRARALSVSLEPVATRHGPRDEVELVVTTRDPSGEPVAADLALSVVDDRLLAHADDEHGHLLSQLHLAPWLSGEPDDPAWYFDPDHDDAGSGLDLVLGTFGWRTFVPAPAAVAANPDAGEGARAKREEGKVGKSRPASIVEALGPVGVQAGVGGLLGPDLAGGLGGRIGNGLGAPGLGLGGGGMAEGLGGFGAIGGLVGGVGVVEGIGGLGTKGMGAGASGFGKGGGSFGEKGEGGGVMAGGDPIVLGSLDRSTIDGVIRRHRNQLRYCYQRRLAANPALAGRVVVKFTIGADGSVPAAQIKGTSLHDAAVEECVLGRFRRMQFAPTAGGGIVIVSYPLIFSPELGGPEAEPVYTPVRVFAQPDYAGKPAPAVRDDLRSTVAWLPDVHTAADGTARVKFFLADPVTTWRVTAEGVGGRHAGRAERELASTLPFSLDVPLPTEVSFGDRLSMPIRLANRTDAEADVALTATVSAPLVAEDGTGAQRLRLAAGEGTVTTVPLVVPDVIGTATIEVAAAAGSLTDALRRQLVVAPRGFPHRFSAGGRLVEGAEHVVHIEDALPGGTEGALVLYPSPVSSLLDGAEALVRMPGGCFEQTSSTNHPNVLVLEYLDRVGGGAGLAVDRTAVLREGYRRLTGYQVDGGGFETFGQGPGKEALSAYGLLQFDRMARVFPEVDRGVTRRDVDFLLGARDGSGGYRNGGVSSHLYGRAPAEVNDAYITRALVETGHLSAGPEIDRQRDLAARTSDPYLLALATLTLARLGEDVSAPAARLAAMMGGDGAFRGAATSIESSGGSDLEVETTGLAALALLRAGRPGEATSAARWLGQARRGSWGWGNTQATILALEAISAVSAADRGAPGTVTVYVDDRPVGEVPYTGAERGPVRFALGSWLGVGEHRVRLVHDGARELPYALEAEWRRDTPADAPGAPLRLETALSADQVALGHTVRLTATVSNPTGAGVASPIARVRLPAGVRVETRALERLKEQRQVAFFETRPREVTLYWEGFAPGERREVGLDLVAEVPGTFSAPPSVVYPYYTSEAVDWAAGADLHVTP